MPFEFTPPRSSLTGTIVDLLQAPGKAQAEAAIEKGQAWAGAANRIGQAGEQAGGEILRARQLQPGLDIQRLQLSEAKKSLSEGDLLKSLAVSTPKVDLGNGATGFDIPAITDAMAKAGADPRLATAHLGPINEGFQQAAAARLSAIQIGAQKLQAVGSPVPLVKDFIDLAVKNRFTTPDQAQKYHDLIDQDPANAPKIVALYAPQPKIMMGKPGDVPYNENTLQPAGPQIPPLPQRPVNAPGVGLIDPATHAVIPGTTPPPNPAIAAQQETARHNGEMEKISRMTAGREVAAQQETARHDRAMEAAANPFAGLTDASAAGSSAQPPAPAINTNTGAPTASPVAAPGGTPAAQTPAGGAPAAAPAPQGAATMPTGIDFLKRLPPPVANQVKAYAEGRMPIPTGMGMAKLQPLLQMITQYDPTFDAANYNARSKTRQDFTSGASAKQITALNTVVGHLDDLSTKSEALGNTDVQKFNAIKNWLKTQTGSPDVTNFDTVRKGVTDELTRVWRQAGGSEQDIKTWGESLNAAQSPKQLTGAFGTIAGMIESRLSALENQKLQGMGAAGKDINIITPRSRTVLDRLQGTKPAAAPTAPKDGTEGIVNGVAAIWKTVDGKSGWYAK